jgi:hypothetical protein
MPDQSKDQEMVERLSNLTMEGHLPWEPYYGNVNPQQQQYDEMSEPEGYVLIDNQFGFGVVTLRLKDPMEEIIEDPRVYVGGDALDVDSYDTGILLDAIKSHVEDVRAGEEPTQQQKMQQKIKKARKPLKKRLERAENRLEQERERVNALIETNHNLSIEKGANVPLTPDTFREALRLYIQESEPMSEEFFQEAFDKSMAQTAISELRNGIQ